ncbi:hypothetical protein [Mycobacterium sp. ENV421]|uniref:hypothetical protein n=1 Tax=Mycobacterium sp. ENV421 TaxID=1213407 RepID=UPI0011571B95|nr:hypothetical protein [Mycobacterium sp. ENV421]
MARDTRGPVPGETDDLRRVSLNPPHWREARRMLAAEAAVLAVLAVITLVMAITAGSRTPGPQILDIGVSAPLGWTLLGAAVAAGVAVVWRRAARVITATLSIGAVLLVVICAVAAVHHTHLFGSTTPVLLVWALVFCYNFAVAIWLVPNHIEGPDWIARRTARPAAQHGKRGRRP